MLVRDPKRFLAGLGAITLATLAVFVCLGFFTGLNDSQARITSTLRGDLVVFDRKTKSVTRFQRMFRSDLYRLLALDGVAEVVPIHQGAVEIKNPETGMYKSIQFFAFPPEAMPFRLPELSALAARLGHPGTIVFDSMSRPHFGPIGAGMEVDVEGVPVRVVGTVRYGPNFGRHGSIFMDTATLTARLGKRHHESISFGLVRARPGTDLGVLKAAIQGYLSKGLKVVTPDELYLREMLFTLRLTPAGALLGLGLLVAIIVGCVVAYQILYTEITDHLAQFATCKAMGFSQGFLSSLVLQEALLLSVLGFAPGVAVTLLVYRSIEDSTRTIMELTSFRVAVGFVLTLLMCAVAARVAVGRAIEADPAELF